MEVKRELAAPCGLYCGVCAIRIAHRDNNEKFKEKLAPMYGVKPEDLRCEGCLSDDVFFYCKVCPIKDCTREKGYEGCNECDEFPCKIIDDFPVPVGRKVMLRSVPAWRELGTERWMEEEEKRYSCPHCGTLLFRGARRCRNCKEEVDLD
jgi:predicted RNA-binding Zn-ribbon protein involved in translation (DUF1610 family)